MMTRPNIAEVLTFMTTTDVARELGLNPPKLKKRLKAGTLPTPTYVNEFGIRFFDRTWLRAARLVMGCERGVISPFELADHLERLGVSIECTERMAKTVGAS